MHKPTFRFAPTTAESGRLVHRPRITLALAARFERRLTLITAAAGYGKTAALALAVENNLLEPSGRDVWFSAIPRDADAEHAASGLARAFDVDNSGGLDAILERIHDAVWAQAPGDVALIIDDAHLFDSDGSRELLQRLIAELPANGHIVLASRSHVDIATARLRAHGQVIDVSARELEFDVQEIELLVAIRQRASSGSPGDETTVGDLPRHAATADLALAAGTTASIDFLWEEILAHLPADRLTDLQRVAVVEALDDKLVSELTDGRFVTDALVADLPLTVRIGSTVRMHTLLRDALQHRLTPAERRKALAVAGDVERRRHRWAEAVHLFQAAGDPISTTETVIGFCTSSMLSRTVEDSLVVSSAIDELQPNSGLAGAARSHLHWMTQASHRRSRNDLIADMDRSIALLREEGHRDVEASQLHLRLQAGLFMGQPLVPEMMDRLAELGETSSLARCVHAFNESLRRSHAGDLGGAIEILSAFDEMHPTMARQWRNERFADLGQLDAIDWTGDPDTVETTALMSGYARWLRGDAPPDLAYAIVAETISGTVRKGFDFVSTSALGVGVAIAAAAGENSAARRWAKQAEGFLDGGLFASAELFVHLAKAIIAASEGDEDTARDALDPARTGIAFDGWPARPLLLQIPLIYLVRPDARPMFDRCEFDAALTTAVQAGQALVALREHGDFAPAAALPWSKEWLLRANVLPVHFVELACAASIGGATGSAAQSASIATTLASSTPHLGDLLRITRERADPALIEAIDELAGGLTVTAPYTLTTTLLGDPTIFRDGVPIEDDRWTRRGRLRELWTYLVVHRRTTRHAIIADVWPESETDKEKEKKALANLRSTLSMLVSILEPDRPHGHDSFFIRTQGDTVELNEAIVTDLDTLQSAADSALAADTAGLPLEALKHHERVVKLSTGPLAGTIEAGWLFFDRLRHQAMATASLCRLAELTAGRGEPEAAARWAQRAQHLDPLNERAGRLFVEALAASGDRSAARTAAQHIAETAEQHGITLEPATTRVFDRLTD